MRRREEAAPGTVEVPERLLVCYVEDWLRPGETLACEHGACGGDVCRCVTVRSRHRDARARWLREQGLTREQVDFPASSRPRRRPSEVSS